MKHEEGCLKKILKCIISFSNNPPHVSSVVSGPDAPKQQTAPPAEEH